MPDDRLPENISETVSVPLSTEALRHFTDALAAATTAEAAYDALCALTKATVGAKLFTVMTVDMTAMLACRTYTDDPENYPTSGTKPIEMNDWFEIVHGQHRSFVANTLEEIDQVFPDAELIGALGCGSVINLPVLIGSELAATINILHEPGYYTEARVEAAKALLTLPAMATLAFARQL
ncbi:GAF domain-containing protein [Phaeobacter inhibens]|uniref:GAF domain-containing protein n=1 Tax=Phaeobacter inhibens TaxID=221822 RepID=UPI0021A59E48|nr:GAF domain-containing protein [Phaeobacter inhibens]UWR59966.1 GAF domain-containing protein [Phaeobacter inhibens]